MKLELNNNANYGSMAYEYAYDIVENFNNGDYYNDTDLFEIVWQELDHIKSKQDY